MKKNRLSILCLILTFLVSTLNFVPSYAQDCTDDIIISLQIDNPIMEINGTSVEIDRGRGTAPLISGGRTLVPIRAIIEAFGGSVSWSDISQTVTLNLDEDSIKLTINCTNAYLNGKAQTIDTAPCVINERTMLPLRFVAEGFNLGVAWDDATKTVTVIRETFTNDEYTALTKLIPTYSGVPYATINNNTPFFKDYEIIAGAFEYYSKLDYLGRANVCMASVDKSIMPTEKRESISSVTPTGWINNSYDIVSGGYLYNRCHLIGYQLTGENANRQNLITGTRYMNVDGMLPFENYVDDYIERTGNSVVYRSTPVFSQNNLVADGVLLEAYSIEDNGSGISFCVYCYNVQPGIYIEYLTGANSPAQNAGQTTENIQSTYPTPDQSQPYEVTIYRTPTGKKYHFSKSCGGNNSYIVTYEEAIGAGLTPCAKCAD